MWCCYRKVLWILSAYNRAMVSPLAEIGNMLGGFSIFSASSRLRKKRFNIQTSLVENVLFAL
jgi:hypothetical protein